MGGLGWTVQRRWLATVLALSIPSPSLANPSAASVELVLQGSIAPKCAFSDPPQELSIAPDVELTASSPLGFSCNLPDAQTVNLTIASANGALKRDGAGAGLAYVISWSVGGETPVDSFAPGTEAATFPVAAGPAGTGNSGSLSVRLSEPPTQAGIYSDQITFTLSP